jgi:tRNA pseudouridine38-40 synthase
LRVPQTAPKNDFTQKSEYIPPALLVPAPREIGYPVTQTQTVTEILQSAPIDSTSSPASDPQNWKLTLAYDGTDFKGWQVQPGERTIQGELQSALGRILGETPLPQGSGRTDAGVHALAQVASFPLATRIPAANLQRALNGTLPSSVRIIETRTVRSTFHARHSARAKTYEYRIFRALLCPPFLARYVYASRWPMDLNALDRAAAAFVGTHDFLSFAASDPDLTTRDAAPARQAAPAEDGKLTGTIKTIFSSSWSEQQSEAGPLLVYRVRGSGFLHHMVRNLVGTMLDIGRGHIAVEAIPQILAARSRSAAGPTAPARGLFLHSVEYRPEDELPA